MYLVLCIYVDYCHISSIYSCKYILFLNVHFVNVGLNIGQFREYDCLYGQSVVIVKAIGEA